MHAKPIDVVILTEDRYAQPDLADWYQAQIFREEALVADALVELGLQVERRSWSDTHMDWARCRCVLFRSTWDYFDRFAEFSPWLERVSATTRLFNDAELIRWNVDKHYLADLAAEGVAVVPTRFVERGASIELAAIMAAEGWDEVVFKPAVSGAARLTYRVDKTSLAEHEAVFARCVASEAMMVQPFERGIVDDGELSVIVIDGQTTHAIRKTARAGDFRVQDDHGGTVHAHQPDAAQRIFAEAAVAACPSRPLYARVDFVRSESGAYRLMELELVEPELFFRFHPPAAAALARALAEKLR